MSSSKAASHKVVEDLLARPSSQLLQGHHPKLLAMAGPSPSGRAHASTQKIHESDELRYKSLISVENGRPLSSMDAHIPFGNTLSTLNCLSSSC